jgi:hypothetical protein
MAGRVVFLGSLLVTPVVAGKPFTASYERRTSKPGTGEELERGTLAVDRDGRARTSVEMSGAPSVAAIWDPVSRSAWIVDDSSNHIRMDLPWPEETAEASAPTPTPVRNPVSSASRSLGTRRIDGLSCEGTETTLDSPEGRHKVERWISSDLGHVVFEVHSDHEGRTTTFRMFDIKTGDPAATLFEPKR